MNEWMSFDTAEELEEFMRNNNPEGHNQYTVKFNGVPLDKAAAAGRKKAYEGAFKDAEIHKSRGTLEDMNVSTPIGHGLGAGIHPDKIKSDLIGMGHDPERINNLVDRQVSQRNITYEKIP